MVIGIVRDRIHAVSGLAVMQLIRRAAGLLLYRAHDLFSTCRCLWRIAGLPNPGAEAMSYVNCSAPRLDRFCPAERSGAPGNEDRLCMQGAV